MRTSRISRETARIANALFPPNEILRRSLRNASHAPDKGGPPTDENEQPEEHRNGDALRAHPPSESSEKSSLGKRKRQEIQPALPSSDNLDKPPPLRHSPRKAPKTKEAHRAKKQPSKHIKNEDGSTAVEPPANWEQMYNITAEMRKEVLAPVDTMGCESLAEEHRSPRDQRLQTLVALMLSSQTKDTVTAVAMKNLQASLPGGFNLDALLQVPPEQLNKLIEKVGFHNNKTKFIKSVATILRDKFNSDIPDTIEGLVSLPGVGPKMAYLCMSAAWGRDEGIGVDVHVHRITNLWGWHKTKSPEETRAELEAWLPREKWHDINHLLVGFGQTICLPVGRKCGECRLSTMKLCPSAVASSPTKKKATRLLQVKSLEGQALVKEEERTLETEVHGTTVNLNTKGIEKVELHTKGVDLPDIEGIGAGRAQRWAQHMKDEGQ